MKTIIGYCHKNAPNKAAEATGEFIASRIIDKIEQAKPALQADSRNVKEIIIQREQRKKYWLN